MVSIKDVCLYFLVLATYKGFISRHKHHVNIFVQLIKGCQVKLRTNIIQQIALFMYIIILYLASGRVGGL